MTIPTNAEVRQAARALLPWVRLQIARGEPVDVERAARTALDTAADMHDTVRLDRRHPLGIDIRDALFGRLMERVRGTDA